MGDTADKTINAINLPFSQREVRLPNSRAEQFAFLLDVQWI